MDSLLPGETYGMPNGMQVGGLLSNPALQIGLGILANNNSKNLGQVLGRGALQGLGNLQQQQAFQAQLAQQAQIAKFNEARQKQLEIEAQQTEMQNQAIEKAVRENPQLESAIRLDPKGAMKLLNPQLNQADPFTEVIYDEQGRAWLNNRRETDPSKVLQPININGQPFKGAKYSPELLGGIKQAEAGGAAAYKVDTSIPGVVSTAKQVAETANPSLVNPANYPQVTPQAQRSRDDMRMKILLDEQVKAGGPGRNPELDAEISTMRGRGFGGIQVPRPEQQAALTEQAKADVGLGIDKVKNVKKADQFLTVAQQAKQILNDTRNPPTASGIGAAVDAAGNLIGAAPKGANEAARLEALSGWLVANVPRMEGPQSNFDVQNYQTMAGLIGDRTKPISVRQGALKEVMRLQEQYKALNQDGQIMPKNETIPKPAKARPPMKGQVVDGYKFKGGNPADPNNWELK